MPDITMCAGTGCPLRDSCYRFYAKPSEWQSFFSEVPYDHEVGLCLSYWKKKDQRRARITEVCGPAGELLRLEAHDADNGGHIIDAPWDPDEENTRKNREAFRDWFNLYLRRKSIEPIN